MPPSQRNYIKLPVSTEARIAGYGFDIGDNIRVVTTVQYRLLDDGQIEFTFHHNYIEKDKAISPKGK